MQTSRRRASIWTQDQDSDLSDPRGGGRPRKLLLSINSGCTLQCTHCVRGHFPVQAGQLMPRVLLDQIVDDFFPYVSTVWLGGLDLGEQMQAPDFDYLLERVDAFPHLDVEMVTSGIALTANRSALIARTMSHLYLSVEGATDGYREVRGIRWDALERRLDWLAAARANTTRPCGERLRLSLHMTVLKPSMDDALAWIDLARRWNIDSIDYRHFIPLLPSQCAQSLLYFPAESDEFFSRLQTHADRAGLAITVPSSLSTMPTGVQRRACHLPFETMGIHPDGRIAACCNASFALGTYQPGRDAITRVWTSDAYAHLRNTVNSATPLPACATCDSVTIDPRAYRPRFGALDRAKLRLKQLLPASVSARLSGLP